MYIRLQDEQTEFFRLVLQSESTNLTGINTAMVHPVNTDRHYLIVLQYYIVFYNSL